MNYAKPALKFNRKVYIVPYDKLSNIADEGVKPQQQKQKQHHKEPSGDSETADLPTLMDKDSGLQSILTSNDQFQNAMAICYMLHLKPHENPQDKELLLFTQDGTRSPPKDLLHFYHTLEVAEVPLSLIKNVKLRKVLQHFRRMREAGQEDDDDDEEYDDEETTEDNEKDVKEVRSRTLIPNTKRGHHGSKELKTDRTNLTEPTLHKLWDNRARIQKAPSQKRSPKVPKDRRKVRKTPSVDDKKWISLF